MWGCRKAQGLIAASIYEPLAEAEQAYLEAHILRCAACHADAAALPVVAALIPQSSIRFSGDLLPALLEQLPQKPRAVFPWRRLVPTLAVVALCIAAATVYFPMVGSNIPESNDTPVATSVIATVLDDARRLREKSDDAAALQLLQQATAAHPEDPRAGEAQLMLADLLFTEFQQYPQAYEAYQTLREQYPQTFLDSDSIVKDRFGLLDEARVQGYAPLVELDRARVADTNKFASLEKVVSSYPNTYVAALAVEEMAQDVAGSLEQGRDLQTAAFEEVRSRCTHPIAVAQVNLLLGDRYWSLEHDSERARAAYQDVVAHGPEILAAKAEAALTRLAASR